MIIDINLLYDEFKQDPNYILPHLYTLYSFQTPYIDPRKEVIAELNKLQTDTQKLYESLDTDSKAKLKKEKTNVETKLTSLKDKLDNDSAITAAIIASIQLNRMCTAMLGFEKTLKQFCTKENLQPSYSVIKASILYVYAIEALRYFTINGLEKITPHHEDVIERFYNENPGVIQELRHKQEQKFEVESAESISRLKLMADEFNQILPEIRLQIQNDEQTTRQSILTLRKKTICEAAETAAAAEEFSRLAHAAQLAQTHWLPLLPATPTRREASFFYRVDEKILDTSSSQDSRGPTPISPSTPLTKHSLTPSTISPSTPLGRSFSLLTPSPR